MTADEVDDGSGGGSAELAARVGALRQAVTACRGRLDEATVEEAAAVVDRVESRLRLSGDATVVALAGATGSGKSSTFNALTGLELAGIGVRRPTTSWTMSCTWGALGSEEVLDWLGVPPRHRVTRNSMLDNPTAAEEERDLAGLVLLDLPDHDSTEVAHHVEVDRLVAMADLLVWVLDPQKYADAAIHDGYLKPLAEHRDILLIVLNHIDEVPEQRRPAILEDLERLLEADGLGEVPVIATSARHGEGIDELKKEISSRVHDKRAITARCLADVAATARRLQEASGMEPAARREPGPAGVPAEGEPGERAQEMTEAFTDAAGVSSVVLALEQSARRRARQATGWPLTSWLGRLRPDPLRRLQLEPGTRGRARTAPRAALPGLTSVQRARVDGAVRAVADEQAEGLPQPWAQAVRAAAVSRLPDLSDALDRALSGVELPVRTPLWCRGVQAVQWLLLLVAVCGAVWLAGLGAGAALRAPTWGGLSLPAVLLVGAVVAGLVLSLLCQGLVVMSVRLRAATVERRLRVAVGEVAERLVAVPIRTELEAYAEARRALADALR